MSKLRHYNVPKAFLLGKEKSSLHGLADENSIRKTDLQMNIQSGSMSSSKCLSANLGPSSTLLQFMCYRRRAIDHYSSIDSHNYTRNGLTSQDLIKKPINVCSGQLTSTSYSYSSSSNTSYVHAFIITRLIAISVDFCCRGGLACAGRRCSRRNGQIVARDVLLSSSRLTESNTRVVELRR